MSIYDREYVRVGPRSTSGLGSLGVISFNSWIIILNVAVFVLNIAVAGRAVPVIVDVRLDQQGKDVPAEYQRTDGVLRDGLGNPIQPSAVRTLQGPRGPMAQPVYRYGAAGRELVRDSRTNELIGTITVEYMSPVEANGYFSTATGFLGLQLWRFITFQFLHANITHVMFNMFGLWVFGGMVEQYLGSKRYVAFYLTCGIFGAISYLILNLLGNLMPSVHLPGVLPDSLHTPLVGASAGVFGVILACAYIAPNAIVVLLFPPIPLKLKWVAYGYVILALANLLRGGQNAGGDAAHIGGAIAGFFFIRNAHLLRDFFEVFGPGKGAARPPRGQVPQDEVDRILRKVAQQGLRSLSDSEKRTLQQASERMRG